MNNRPLRWGVPSRRVVWLPVPTVFDRHMPDYCRVEYCFGVLMGTGKRRYRELVLRTTDPEQARRWVIAHHVTGQDLFLWTRWVTPDGKVEHKLPLEPLHYVQEDWFSVRSGGKGEYGVRPSTSRKIRDRR